MMQLLSLYISFFKTGLFAVGGGLATLPFLYDIADATGWFTHHDIADLLAISECTPGAIGINAATYAGYLTSGVFGGLVATLGLITPSIFIIIMVSRVLSTFAKHPLVVRAFYALRPASLALIAAAGLTVLQSVLLPTTTGTAVLSVPNLVLGLALWCAMQKWDKVHPIVFLAIAALAGIAMGLCA